MVVTPPVDPGQKIVTVPEESPDSLSARATCSVISRTTATAPIISAAAFLKEFAGDTPWVHLDIAGTAWLEEAKPFLAKGPSGLPVRTFIHLAMNW